MTRIGSSWAGVAREESPDNLGRVDVSVDGPDESGWQILRATGPSVTPAFNRVEHHFRTLGAG